LNQYGENREEGKGRREVCLLQLFYVSWHSR
jgi:hypothetical protein